MRINVIARCIRLKCSPISPGAKEARIGRADAPSSRTNAKRVAILVTVASACLLASTESLAEPFQNARSNHMSPAGAHTDGQRCSAPPRHWFSRTFPNEPGRVNLYDLDNGICEKLTDLINRGMIENFDHPACNWMFRIKSQAIQGQESIITPRWESTSKRPNSGEEMYVGILPWSAESKQTSVRALLYITACDKKWNVGASARYVIDVPEGHDGHGSGYPVSYKNKNYSIEFEMRYNSAPSTILINSPAGGVCIIRQE